MGSGMRFVFISLIATGTALASIANAGFLAVIFLPEKSSQISFTAVIIAIILANMLVMIGIIGLHKLVSLEEISRPQHKQKENLLATVIHLSGLLIYIGLPLGYLFGPWLAWISTRRKSDTLNIHGKKAVNFALTMGMFFTAALILVFLFIGFLLVALLIIFHLIVLLRNGWLTYRGCPSRYPFKINFLD